MTTASLLGYVPFLHPLNIFHVWWYLLLIPLSFGIAITYKAIRLHSLEHYWRHVTIMTLQIVFAMIGLAIGLVLLVQFVVPYLAAE